MRNVVWCESPEPGSVKVGLSTGEWLTYRCVPDAHHIAVSDARQRIQFAVGTFGRLPGQFDTPLDIAIVTPRFEGESVSPDRPEALWLAVADYGNNRVQVLELNGAFVGSIGSGDGLELRRPCRLRWREPVLDVETPDGEHIALHLAAALLTRADSTFPAAGEWTMPPFGRRCPPRHRLKVC